MVVALSRQVDLQVIRMLARGELLKELRVVIEPCSDPLLVAIKDCFVNLLEVTWERFCSGLRWTGLCDKLIRHPLHLHEPARAIITRFFAECAAIELHRVECYVQEWESI